MALMDKLVLRNIYNSKLDKVAAKRKKKQARCKHKKIVWYGAYYHCKRCDLIEMQYQYDYQAKLNIETDILKP